MIRLYGPFAAPMALMSDLGGALRHGVIDQNRYDQLAGIVISSLMVSMLDETFLDGFQQVAEIFDRFLTN